MHNLDGKHPTRPGFEPIPFKPQPDRMSLGGGGRGYEADMQGGCDKKTGYNHTSRPYVFYMTCFLLYILFELDLILCANTMYINCEAK